MRIGIEIGGDCGIAIEPEDGSGSGAGLFGTGVAFAWFGPQPDALDVEWNSYDWFHGEGWFHGEAW